MAPQPIEKRVETLEQQVTELRHLPDRMTAVESQIVQLRTETRDEFSAVRGEMRAEFGAVRQEMADGFTAVRKEVRAGDEETRRYMRVLHEDVIARIAAIRNG